MLKKHPKNRKDTHHDETHEPSAGDTLENQESFSGDRDESGAQVNEAGVTEPSFEASDDTRITELNNRYLRLMAEYDNFRKRTIREKEDIIRTATEDLMKSLLPILDNLDRATEHRNNQQTLEEYVKGISLIEDQLRATLSGAGLERMDVVGTPFDPELHDAILQMESKDHEPGTVINEVEKGYTLSGKVIRHPKVVVSR